jgi:hypothetical protein
MSRVLRTRTPFAFLLLEHAASILGLLVVLGIMVSVFVATGVIDTTQVTQSQSIVSEMWGTVASAIHSWSVWLAGRFSPLQGNSALGIMVVATIVVAVIAGVDRVVGRRFIQKT